MKDELAAWNNGRGIDLESWVSCEGNFSLAVGYASIFCPNFVEFEGYIFAGDSFDKHDIKRLRGFEGQGDANPKSIEWVMNHFHIDGMHHNGCDDLTVDKIVLLGNKLKENYEARLAYFFPDKPCIVEFYQPDDELEIEDYQLSFWQRKYDL